MRSQAQHIAATSQFTASTERVRQVEASPPQPSHWFKGVLLAALIAIVALVLGRWLPTVGGPVFAILIGVFWRNTIGVNTAMGSAIAVVSKKLLQWSIIGLGFGLSFKQVMQTGMDSLSVTVVTVVVAFVTAYFLGRALKLSSTMRTLIGAGTAICGGSAIAAVAPIIEPEDHETALAISTIFLFNIAAVVIFPLMGHVLQMSDLGFGLWAGTAINDTSSVVAAAYSYSTEAGDYATIVKLTRASLIIPLCIGLAFLHARANVKAGRRIDIKRVIPWFIMGFLFASAIRSSGILPLGFLVPIQQMALFLMVMALAAVGLTTDLKCIVKTGWKPLALGLGVWVAVSVSSLGVQYIGESW